MPAHRLPRAILVCLAVVFASAAYAEPNWGNINWTPLPGYTNPQTGQYPNNLNDPDDGMADQRDFVGSANDPGGYYSWDSDYVYFRMRMDSGIAPTYGDQLYIFIDVPGIGTNYHPDYALTVTWNQEKNASVSLYTSVTNNTSDYMWDRSYLSGSQAASGSSVQTTDNVSSSDFGSYDSFVDWAISYADVTSQSQQLLRNATFRFQFAAGPPYTYSEGGGQNCNNLEDVAGYQTLGSNGSSYATAESWAQITAPEPASMALTLLALGIAGGAVRRRKAKAEDDSEPLA